MIVSWIYPFVVTGSTDDFLSMGFLVLSGLWSANRISVTTPDSGGGLCFCDFLGVSMPFRSACDSFFCIFDPLDAAGASERAAFSVKGEFRASGADSGGTFLLFFFEGLSLSDSGGLFLFLDTFGLLV